MNLASLFYRQVTLRPEAPALWISGDIYSYAALHRVAAAIAAAIHGEGRGGRHPHVALLASRSLSAYAGLLGALYAGRAYVPLNPRFPAERNERMVAFTGASTIVADPRCEAELRALLRNASPKVVLLPEHESLPAWVRDLPAHTFFSAAELFSTPVWFAPVAVEESSGAYTIFTSGSTGDPKAVRITHHNVEALLKNLAFILRLTPADRCSQNFDLTFDGSVPDLWLTWEAGASLYVIPENSALFGARFVTEHEISFWNSVPSTAAFLRHHGFLKPGALPTLRISLFGGETLPAALAEDWQRAAPNSAIYNFYGPTEATVMIAGHRFRLGQDFGEVPIGFLNNSLEAAVVDENLSPLPAGQKGELCVSGDQVAPGYWKEPALTAAKFVRLPNQPAEKIWYRTGDLVARNEEFGFQFYGRADRQVKLKGFRVELSEIESTIRRASGSDLVAVLGLRSEKSQGFVGTAAFVSGGHKTESEILASCRAQLPDYMVPLRVALVDSLPFNANGKIDYRRLETEPGTALPSKILVAENRL